MPPPPYILVYKNPPDQKATQDTLKFFQWSLEKGDQLALGLDYVPLPENAVKAVEASWKNIKVRECNGRPTIPRTERAAPRLPPFFLFHMAVQAQFAYAEVLRVIITQLIHSRHENRTRLVDLPATTWPA